MWKEPDLVQAGSLQSASFGAILLGGVGKHATRRAAAQQVLNRELLRGGTEPPPTNSRVREEDVELPVDHVRIREEQLAKLTGTDLGNPLVGALCNGIKSPTDKDVDVRLGGRFEEDHRVLKCL
jgi:hypothetical protein